MKKRLMASLLSLLVCVSMLIGSTFAWFTDKATTGVNTIEAGTLSVELQMKNTEGAWVDAEGQTLNFIKADGAPAGEAVLWEPGAAYKLPEVRVVNTGSLKLEYRIALSAVNGNTTGNGADLADVIDVYFGEDLATAEQQGTLSSVLTTNDGVFNTGAMNPGAVATYGTVILKMQENAGNEYQGLSLENIAITVNAIQLDGEMPGIVDANGNGGKVTGEYDSFGNSYDAGAQFLAPAADLKTAFANYTMEEGTAVVTLTKSYDAEGKWTALTMADFGNASKIRINGGGNTIANLNDCLVGHEFTSVEINDLTITGAKIVRAGRGLGLGAFVRDADVSRTVALTRCKLVGSTVIDTSDYGFAGGLIGYSSGTSVSIVECEVVDSVMQAYDSVGGLIGYASSPVTVTGGKVTGCTFTVTGPDDTHGPWRVGAIGGTFNTGGCTVTVSGFTQSGNTFNMESATASQVSELYGRVIYGATFNVTP